MNLRTRTILMVTLLIAGAVLTTTAFGVISTRQALTDLQAREIQLIEQFFPESGNRETEFSDEIARLSNERIQEHSLSQVRQGFAVSMLVIAIGVIASIWLARVMTAPVTRMIQAAKNVQSGVYVPDEIADVVTRTDEIGNLGRVFDSMAREVGARDRRLSLLKAIIPVGVAMSAERDFNRLLETIVLEAQKITNAEGGTLYLREGEKLRFVIIRNNRLGLALGGATGREVTFQPLALYDSQGQPNHHQIAPSVALSGKYISVGDAYATDKYDFSGTKAFDAQTGYRTQSVLAIPLRGNDDSIIGVLQLINARSDEGAIIPFEEDEVVDSLALITSAALSAYIREEQLRQEINKLRIEVDLVKQAKQVEEITETDYFQQLQARAKKLRRQG